MAGTMIAESGIGLSVEPWHDLVVMQLTNPQGGRVPVPLTLEESMKLGCMLVEEALLGKLAMEEE